MGVVYRQFVKWSNGKRYKLPVVSKGQ
uniref:Uncharacterized protein n=1 Tax=Arundo donax TaxID=35708 RepID=A0A0A9CG89_ARUDO